MADYMVYWKTFSKGTQRRGDSAGNWASRSKTFYERVKKGDRVWIVVTAGARARDEWRLLESFTVERRGRGETQWGNYMLHGRDGSRIEFDLGAQPDLTAILWLLSFKSAKPIRVKGARIGKALQSHGFRALSEKDADILLAYAATLPRRSAA